MKDFKKLLAIKNKVGLEWTIEPAESGYPLGAFTWAGKLIESPLSDGLFSLRNIKTGERCWLCADSAEKDGDSIRLSGKIQVDSSTLTFSGILNLASDSAAACFLLKWQLDRDLPNWEVCISYHKDFQNSWLCHLYPFAENSKFLSASPLEYVGVPSALFYRDDFSLGILYGIDVASDYLNPTTWTSQVGLHFTDQVTAPEFRVSKLQASVDYNFQLHIIFSQAGNPLPMIAELVQSWIKLNDFKTDQLIVRTPQEALALFLDGREKTSAWKKGFGYRLEEGDPESNFIYLGEQPLSAYFEYLIFERTGVSLWRERAFEQMDFVLKAQTTDSESIQYGAFHTAYDLGKLAFDSDDRGRNIGYKPDLNAYMARYILELWKHVKEHEGIDRQDWYSSAILASNWVLRQQNADGGLPQKVDVETGAKSISSTAGRALPAMSIIHALTGDNRFHAFAESLEAFTRQCVENRFYFTGHHPDLPPDELEEASIWGVIEYWLDKYDRTGDEESLERATSDAYLAFLWWCPKQLSWVRNPTQCSAAEQQHFLQYSIYCYQNRKIQCLYRLAKLTNNTLFSDLYERILQGVFWTQVVEGDQQGATYERIADPWLARNDYDESDFNSLGSKYIGEQSLDTMLQLLEMDPQLLIFEN